MSKFIVGSMLTTIEIKGTRRTFTVVGAAQSHRTRDLILVFHGSKQDGEKFRRFTGGTFDALAETGDAVVVYLNGYRGNWNDSRRESSFAARLENIDDVAFAQAVVEEMAISRGIDPRRVFAIGYSNGGQMVMRLMHEKPEMLAGAAIFSATMPGRESFLFPDASPAAIPVLLIHGTRDPIVPYDGGSMKPWARRMFKVGGSTLAAGDTAAYFARSNGITSEPQRVGRPIDLASRRTWIERTDYRQDGHQRVRLYTVHGGGHTIPGPRKAPFILGPTNGDISAAAEVAEFFELTIGHAAHL